MMFLGNLLFAGVLGKSTGNANLAALIQKNIAERVDPSFRAHKAEHVGISTRDLTARYLMPVVYGEIFDWKLLRIVGIIKALINHDKNLRWAWIVLLILCPINYIIVIIWQSLALSLTDTSNISFLGYLGYDTTPGFMAVLMFLGMFYQESGKIVLNYWLQWFVSVLLVGILGNLFGQILPNVFYPNDNINKQAQVKASIILVFTLPAFIAYVVLIALPLRSTLESLR